MQAEHLLGLLTGVTEADFRALRTSAWSPTFSTMNAISPDLREDKQNPFLPKCFLLIQKGQIDVLWMSPHHYPSLGLSKLVGVEGHLPGGQLVIDSSQHSTPAHVLSTMVNSSLFQAPERILVLFI